MSPKGWSATTGGAGMVVAVDAGYGYTKVANAAGRLAVWPTTVRA